MARFIYPGWIGVGYLVNHDKIYIHQATARWISNRPRIRPGIVKSLNAPWEMSQLALRRDYAKKIDPCCTLVQLGRRTVPQDRVSTPSYLVGRYKLSRSCSNSNLLRSRVKEVGYIVYHGQVYISRLDRSRIHGLSWLGLYIQEDTGVGYLVYHGQVCISRRIQEQDTWFIMVRFVYPCGCRSRIPISQTIYSNGGSDLIIQRVVKK